MSTILDALRKLEEDTRVRNADARTRLLSVPSRFDLRLSRRRRVPWTLSGGLIFAGLALGAGLILWRPTSQPAEQEEPKAEEVVAKNVPPSPQPPALPPEQPVAASPSSLPQTVEQGTPTTPNEGAFPQTPTLPQEGASPPPRVAQATPPGSSGFSLPLPPGGSIPPPSFPQPLTPNQFPAVPSFPQATIARVPSEGRRDLPGDFPVAGESNIVQRSPFVTTPAPERSAAPAPPPGERSMAMASKPASTSPSKSTKAAKTPVTANMLPSPPAPTPEERNGPPPINASLNFLQWSPESDKRIAFIKIDQGPTTLVHEGDTIGGATVVEIRQDAVELSSGESRWTLRAR